MTKRDWSSIHGEVKEAESMKSHSGGVGSRMGWKSPSNDFQNPRESWRDAQDIEKVE